MKTVIIAGVLAAFRQRRRMAILDGLLEPVQRCRRFIGTQPLALTDL
jgi:hypothetical protein